MRPTSYGLRRLPAMAAAPEEPSARRAEGLPAFARLPRVGVIRNPRSHRNKGADADCQDNPSVIAAAPRSKPELAEALARFAREQVGLLAIDGGDGTIRDVLTRAAPVFGDNWPRIIILPKGKTNALALDLGVPRRWQLAEALGAAEHGSVVTRRPLVVERLDAEERDRIGFILGAGIFNAAVRAGQVAHRAGAFQGFAVGVTAAFGVSQALFGIGASQWRRNSPMRISIPGGGELGQSVHGSAGERFLAGFSSLSRFPLGLRPFPAPLGADAINYIVMDAPLRRAVAMLPAAFFGRDTAYIRGLGIQRGVASGFRLELGDSFILDGETFPAGDYRVRLGPELHFVVP